MTHFKKLRDPNFFGSWDLEDGNGGYTTKIVTIKNVQQQKVHDGKDESNQAVVYFHECKPIVGNSTNLKAIAKMANSPHVEKWVGLKIELFVTKVRAFGDVHDAIRVRKPTEAKAKQKTVLTPEDTEKWDAAISFIKDGGSVDAIAKKYEISPEHVEKLTTDAANSPF